LLLIVGHVYFVDNVYSLKYLNSLFKYLHVEKQLRPLCTRGDTLTTLYKSTHLLTFKFQFTTPSFR